MEVEYCHQKLNVAVRVAKQLDTQEITKTQEIKSKILTGHLNQEFRQLHRKVEKNQPSNFPWKFVTCAAQKIKFSIKYFFSKYDQIRSLLWIWSHLLKKSLMENFIFCVVFVN